MRLSRPTLVAGSLLLAACGASEAAEPGTVTEDTSAATLAGVGALPPTVPDEEPVEVSTTLVEPEVVITRPVDEETGVELATVGEQVDGNRVIMLGDSILAATSSRYGREMCDALVPMGWAVEVDAEPGRFVDFGNRVLRQRLDPDNGLDWDAAVVFLGSNYRSDPIAYEAELDEILDALAPRPTLLYTVTVYRSTWAQVNEVVRREADERDNVTLVDWETVARTPGVLSGDRLHPGEAGEQVLVELTADALGEAPEVLGFDGVAVEGECLPTNFSDDSAIGSGTLGGSTAGSGSGSGSSTGGSSSGGNWSGSSGSSSGGGSSTGGSGSGGSSTGGSSGGGSGDGTGSGTGDGSGDGTGDGTGGSGDGTGGSGEGTGGSGEA